MWSGIARTIPPLGPKPGLEHCLTLFEHCLCHRHTYADASISATVLDYVQIRL
jgi:hypothetical protein